MGKLFKLGMVILSAFVLIFIIVGVIRGIPNVGKDTNPAKQSDTAKPGKAEYDKIRVGDSMTGQGGLTIAEVEKILGQPTSQTEGNSGNLKMEVYTFAGSAGPNSILVTFIKGHVSGKSQTGLK